MMKVGTARSVGCHFVLMAITARAVCASGAEVWATEVKPRVSLQFAPTTNTIILGTPLKGDLMLTTLVGRATDFAGFRDVEVLRRSMSAVSAGLWETGYVRCSPTRFPDSRSGRSVIVSSEEGKYGAPGPFPGLIWFQTRDDAYNFNSQPSLLFPAPGEYELAFSLDDKAVAVTEIQVLPPVGRDALAWEALPLKVYCGIFSPCWYNWENRSELVDARAVETFMRTYGDSCYGDWLMRWAKYYRDNPYGKKNTPSWMSNAWNVVNERYPLERTALDVLREWDDSMAASPPSGVDAATRAQMGITPAVTGAVTSRLAATNANVTREVVRPTEEETVERKQKDVAVVASSKPDAGPSHVRILAWAVPAAALAVIALGLLFRGRRRS